MMQQTIRGEISVEDALIWAFQREKATLWDESGLDATARWPLDSCIKIEKLDLLGKIDTTSPGARYSAKDVAHDAEVIASAVMDLPPALRHLVHSHAVAGNRPDWRRDAWHRWLPADRYCPTEGVTVPMHERVDHRGRGNWKSRLEFCEVSGGRRRVPPPTWCPVREVDSPANVRKDRARYLDWARALHDLRGMLEGQLERWALTHALPPLEPWEAERMAA